VYTLEADEIHPSFRIIEIMNAIAVTIQMAAQEIYKRDSRRIFATLVRVLGDLDWAEEAMQEAFSAAMVSWPSEGIPKNPVAWLVSTGKNKAIDELRKRGRLEQRKEEIGRRYEALQATKVADEALEDDRLRLVFACCHPAIDPTIQVALTLREVCGLTTEQIAAAFLIAPTTLAQRLVRGKAKIRDAGIPISVPARDELAARIDTVLKVVYLVFNEGYNASSGASALRIDLSAEAIRLAKLLAELLPVSEVWGLLALMLLHESRRETRFNDSGDIILLEEQDRSRWNSELITAGNFWLKQAWEQGEVGAYSIQAAISATHANAPSFQATNWQQIVQLYDILQQAQPSPIVELNRAVARGMVDGPAVALVDIQDLARRGELLDYHLLHAAEGDFYRRLGEPEKSLTAFIKALALAKQEPERRFLAKRIAEQELQLARTKNLN
jgi:RNA polymerase sigma-70 factor, ECF subfamily